MKKTLICYYAAVLAAACGAAPDGSATPAKTETTVVAAATDTSTTDLSPAAPPAVQTTNSNAAAETATPVVDETINAPEAKPLPVAKETVARCAQPTKEEISEEDEVFLSGCSVIENYSDKGVYTSRPAKKAEKALCVCSMKLGRIFECGDVKLCTDCKARCPDFASECVAQCAYSAISSGSGSIQKKDLATMIERAKKPDDKTGMDAGDLGKKMTFSGFVAEVKSSAHGMQWLRLSPAISSKDYVKIYFKDNPYGDDISCYKSVSSNGALKLIHLGELPTNREITVLCTAGGLEDREALYFMDCTILE